MDGSIILVLTLSAGDPDASLTTMADAMHDLLGEEARVVVEPRSALPADEDIPALEHSVHARAIVEVEWLDAAHDHVRVRVRLHDAARWLDRGIDFAPQDDPSERGRTLGLAVGSMIPAAASEDPAPPPIPDDTPRAAPAASAPAPRSERASEPPPRARAARPRAFSVDVDARGDLGVDRAWESLGARVTASWSPAGGVWLGLSSAVAAGSAAAPDARAIDVLLGAALAWHPVARGAASFGARLDALALYEDVARARAAGGTEHRARWAPVVGASIELLVPLSPALAVLVAVGPAIVFDDAHVYVQGRDIATLAQVRAASDLGFRLRF